MITTAPISKSTCSLVVFEVKINGEIINYFIESITCTDEINKIPGAKIVLSMESNLDSQIQSETYEKLAAGNNIEIKVGYDHADHLIFQGIILRYSVRNRNYQNKSLGGSNIILECKHELVKASLQKKNRVHKARGGDFFKQILKEYKQSVKGHSLELNAAELTQYQQSDWSFLVDKATTYGMSMFVTNQGVSIEKPLLKDVPTITLQDKKTILDMDAELDAGVQTGQVFFQSWNPDTQEEEQAAERLRVEDRQMVEKIGAAETFIYHAGEVSRSEGKQIAEAQKNRRNLSQKRGRVRCCGLTSVTIGDTIAFAGTNTMDGNVFVSAIKHSLTSGQWYTDIQFGLGLKELENYRLQNGQKTDLNGLFTGTVLKIEEEGQKKEKILVYIPALGRNEGVWARMSTLDAGQNRGWRFWPEIKDEVIVGFLQNDPDHPVVLGSLHSENKASPFEATEQNHKKGFRSRSGLELIFDDEKGSISIITSKGNIIQLTDDQEGMILNDQHDNAVILGKDGIILSSQKDVVIKAKGEVNISGQKVSIKSKIKTEIEGKKGLKLTSNAINTIKGNPVKIN